MHIPFPNSGFESGFALALHCAILRRDDRGNENHWYRHVPAFFGPASTTHERAAP
jgi:hypothetical protein